MILSIVALPALVFAADDQTQEAAAAVVAIKPGPDDPKEKVKPGPIDKDAPQEFTTTKSGLKYRILRRSGGARPAETDIVEVHYKGWLDDETVFGSSYRSGDKTSFPLIRVMQGWTEGMQLVGKGGMIELEVPPELGYGKRGKRGAVPPNARLHFIIEIFSARPEIKVM
jgi:FKBP-type peptidyl-prolyl cis-trans isomerase FkpA